MGEGYDFVRSGEDDIVVADDGAASDGTDADLFLGSAFSACTAVVDVFVFVTFLNASTFFVKSPSISM